VLKYKYIVFHQIGLLVVLARACSSTLYTVHTHWVDGEIFALIEETC
jgi:hypothetical protein